METTMNPMQLFEFLTGLTWQAEYESKYAYFLTRLEELIDYTFLDTDGLTVLEAVRDGKFFGSERSPMSKQLMGYLSPDTCVHIVDIHIGYLLARLEELVDYTFLDTDGLAVLEAVRDGVPLPLVKVC